MKCWLASYPRSGNTFLRNILYEVYGIESSAYHQIPHAKMVDEYDRFPVVKTHVLPDELQPGDPGIPAVYLVRDPRDAFVSQAHFQKRLRHRAGGFRKTILEATFAHRGSYFGGWSEHVRQWVDRTGIVIRYEDLIAEPLEQAERIRSILDLPEPNRESVPTFESLKFGEPKYGHRKRNEDNSEFFRRGTAGGWKEDLSTSLAELIWRYHGPVMEVLGYTKKETVDMPKDLLHLRTQLKNTPYPNRLPRWRELIMLGWSRIQP